LFTTLFTKVLQSRSIQISMDGKGRWIDNVFVERNEASSVSTNRIDHRAGRRGSRGAARGTVDNPSCSSSLIACEILSNQPGPPLWS
jgi:hypothetical protein